MRSLLVSDIVLIDEGKNLDPLQCWQVIPGNPTGRPLLFPFTSAGPSSHRVLSLSVAKEKLVEKAISSGWTSLEVSHAGSVELLEPISCSGNASSCFKLVTFEDLAIGEM